MARRKTRCGLTFANLSFEPVLSDEIPNTFALSVNLVYSSRKLQASLVQPGVEAWTQILVVVFPVPCQRNICRSCQNFTRAMLMLSSTTAGRRKYADLGVEEDDHCRLANEAGKNNF